MYVFGYYDRVHYVVAEPPPMPPSNNVWEIGKLAPGITGTIKITVQVDSSLPEGSILVNLMQIDSAETTAIGEVCTTKVTRRPECSYLEEIGKEDGNDKWAEARQIEFSRTYCAYPDDQNDYYRFQLEKPTAVRIEMHHYVPQNHGDLLLYRLTKTGSSPSEPPLELIDQWGKGGDTMYILVKQLEAGDYYVRVYTKDGYYVRDLPYTLAVFKITEVASEAE